MIVEELNERLEPEFCFPLPEYREVRRRLDDFVHATYPALRLYPAQLRDDITNVERLRDLVFWQSLLRFFLVACLLVVRLVRPDLGEQARAHMERLAR